MRKLRLAVVLPLVHIVASMAVFGWHLAPTGGFNGTVRWWLAMNAPVLLFTDVTKRMATMGWLPPTVIWGGGGERTLYLIVLVGGLAVWFLVGRALDILLRRRAPNQTALQLGKVLTNLFLIACGVRLIFHGIESILPQYPGQRHSTFDTANGLIILAWSLLLVLLPGLKLINRIREKYSGQEAGEARDS